MSSMLLEPLELGRGCCLTEGLLPEVELGLTRAALLRTRLAAFFLLCERVLPCCARVLRDSCQSTELDCEKEEAYQPGASLTAPNSPESM